MSSPDISVRSELTFQGNHIKSYIENIQLYRVEYLQDNDISMVLRLTNLESDYLKLLCSLGAILIEVKASIKKNNPKEV